MQCVIDQLVKEDNQLSRKFLKTTEKWRCLIVWRTTTTTS